MINESVIEESIIALLQKEGYEFVEPDNGWFSTRNLDDFINIALLEECLLRINTIKDSRVIEEAIKTIQRIDNPSLFERNYQFHKMLIEGITIDDKNYAVNPLVKLIDFDHPENNVCQVTHQVKFREGHDTRIPDVLIYINGIPLIVMELKTFDEEGTDATLYHAYMQLGGGTEKDGYRFDIPTLFNYNAFLVISDGVTTKVGTLTSKEDRFAEWKSIAGEKGYDKNCVRTLDILIEGLFNKQRLLDVIKNNLFFIQDKNNKPVKIMAQYHQYFGVLKSVKSITSAIKLG